MRIVFGIEKVEINRNSWHYKWLKRWHLAGPRYKYVWVDDPKTGRDYRYMDVEKAPKSICPYFWLLMFSFVAVLGVGLLTILLTFILVGGLVFIAAFLFALILATIAHPYSLLIVLLLAAVVLLIVMFAKWTTERGYYYKEPKKKRTTGFLYVFKTFVKAKKSNVCPLIEFTD